MQFKYNESSVEGLKKEPFQEPFCAAPHRIWLDTSFSFSARSFSAWAYGKPIGWIFKIEHICTELGLSRQQWRTIRTELIERGVFSQAKQKIGDSWHWTANFNFSIFTLSTKVEKQPIARDGLNTTTREKGYNQPVTRTAAKNKLLRKEKGKEKEDNEYAQICKRNFERYPNFRTGKLKIISQLARSPYETHPPTDIYSGI